MFRPITGHHQVSY